MKINKLIYVVFGLTLLLSACNPIEKSYSLGGVLSEEKVSSGISVANEKPGNNKLILKNNLTGVAGMWDYGTGTSLKKDLEVVVPPGTYNVKFTALCDGGVTTVSKTVEVTQVDYELDIEWTYLCGTPEEGGKTWVWATGNPNLGYGGTSTLYGNGGEFANSPEWWKGDAAEIGDAGLYDEMKFTYTGVELIDKSDASTIVTSTSGKFTLDNKIKSVSGHNIAGTLTFPFFPMGKKLDDEAKFDNAYKFELVKLTADEMTLRLRGSSGGWSILYLLKRKGYVYP
ncbi:MAG TPA: hypothetical protein VK152_10410 [Paludibacter sp.]|nr:hypothetical protein [Paludibacter sp.]